MPKLTIEHRHELEHSVVRERLAALNARLAAKYGIDAVWKTDTEATFKRIGASGSISCQTGRVVIVVDLSFALTPLKSKVETRIREELQKALTTAESS